MAKQYKLKFKPTPVSRLLKRPPIPFRMVGYPYASDWPRHYQLNYEFVLAEAKAWREKQEKRAIAEAEYGSSFVNDWGNAA